MLKQKPLVYLIYGIPGSGRREVLYDLIESSIEKGEQALYFHPEDEGASPFDEKLKSLPTVDLAQWKLEGVKLKHSSIKAAPEKIFFLAPGIADPADTAEALKAWIDGNNCQLARIITVVHCSFLFNNEQAQKWFEACIHFSDIVLLNRREEVPNKWIKDFESRYKKLHCPARFLLVKKGRVNNPFEILEPEARRSSLYFDELIPIEDDEFDDDEAPEDIKEDKYVKRLENGQRSKRIENIKKFL